MSSKTWTTQADWQGYSSQSLIPPVDTTTVVNSIVVQKYMWNTNVEDEAIGGFPSVNWTAAIGTAANRVVSTDQYVSSNRSIKLTQPDSTLRDICNIVNFADKAGITMQFSIRAAQIDKYLQSYFQNSAGNLVTAFYMWNDGHFKYWNGSSAVNLPVDTTYLSNAWYTIKVTVNKTTGKVRFYVGADYKGEGTSGNYFCEQYHFNTSTITSPSFWLDDILVWDIYDGVAANYQSPTTANYQLDSGSTSENKWASFSFNGSKPSNTNVRFRFKTASTQAGLATATYSGYYTANGNLTDVPNNRWIEVQVELSTTDGVSTPQLDDLTINYNTVGQVRFI